MVPVTSGICALCQTAGTLCDSHFIPRASYSLLRDPNSSNPEVFHVSEDLTIQRSFQVRGHLLCSKCEQKFNELGEKWVMANCFQFPTKSFIIREQIRTQVPIHTTGRGSRVYALLPGGTILADKLIYFALSVFWRAGAREWTTADGKKLRLDYGRYQEDLRAFLNGGVTLPREFTLLGFVASDDRALGTSILPSKVHTQPCHRFDFTIAGLTFILMIGRRIPQEYAVLSLMPAVVPQLVIASWVDEDIQRMILSQVFRSKKHPIFGGI